MPRRGHSTTIGKIAKFYQDRRASEIRLFGEQLRREQLRREQQAAEERPSISSTRERSAAR
ncbi:hypothetical protein Ais01nite_18010 [Asanoa ishikariensis]|uniref:Uncharacterized protein n=1 Tax=Asanoa ishikariensis TaxID=137265 RepID=A0A1H3UE96_9ACTN|nr:hypothetical protein [Asanoa ishikariensis]GIF63766.1 hypothetical protein Ais01nite_18010 [Asanoa ishikariensis]SDZ60607.1 hypothetical protein SAMN05421684_7075 [Asanoa ishikariensis]